ncbi:hypothetical protein FXO38_23070 [Capsicum annuum]|nr:hypothetical protein FXO37_31984 [Capsicum annuum]KAF3638760.1 hypothetical protein FXO38_23070 [Capsicum annuum]
MGTMPCNPCALYACIKEEEKSPKSARSGGLSPEELQPHGSDGSGMLLTSSMESGGDKFGFFYDSSFVKGGQRRILLVKPWGKRKKKERDSDGGGQRGGCWLLASIDVLRQQWSDGGEGLWVVGQWGNREKNNDMLEVWFASGGDMVVCRWKAHQNSMIFGSSERETEEKE